VAFQAGVLGRLQNSTGSSAFFSPIGMRSAPLSSSFGPLCLDAEGVILLGGARVEGFDPNKSVEATEMPGWK